MTHGAPDGISHTLPTQGAPRVSLGYVPPPMGQERHRLLELLAGPARHVHRHRQGVASRPDADGTDHSLFGGMAGSVHIAGPHPHSVTIQADKMRLFVPLAPVHLLKHPLALPTHSALFSVRAHPPVPILCSDHDVSQSYWSQGQNVSHGG